VAFVTVTLSLSRFSLSLALEVIGLSWFARVTRLLASPGCNTRP